MYKYDPTQRYHVKQTLVIHLPVSIYYFFFFSFDLRMYSLIIMKRQDGNGHALYVSKRHLLLPPASPGTRHTPTHCTASCTYGVGIYTKRTTPSTYQDGSSVFNEGFQNHSSIYIYDCHRDRDLKFDLDCILQT